MEPSHANCSGNKNVIFVIYNIHFFLVFCGAPFTLHICPAIMKFGITLDTGKTSEVFSYDESVMQCGGLEK